MKIIEPNVCMVDCSNPYVKAETAGRVCYKSEENITPDSAKAFVQRAIDRSHFAVLVHETVTFKLLCCPEDERLINEVIHIPYIRHSEYTPPKGYTDSQSKTLHYLTVSLSHLYKPENLERSDLIKALKALFESWVGIQCDLQFLDTLHKDFMDITIVHAVSEEALWIEDNISEEAGKAFWNLHGTYTFKFICDRGVSHELVRHRCAISQESTRYCNYSKDKFGNELTYIRPSTWDEWPSEAQEEWIHQMQQSESAYLSLLSYGLSPQQARAVMPNSLKTEVIMTMPVWQWRHFFNLRSIGTTGAPHPDMKLIATAAYLIFMKAENNRYAI